MQIVTNAFESLYNPDLVFVALDIETTGFSPSSDRILELGAVKFTTENTLGEFEELIDPELESIPESATEVHGITLDMLRGKPTLGEVLPRFLNFARDCILVAHNANFDLGFLKRGLSHYGLGRDLPHQVVDTLTMTKVAFPNRSSYKLQDLAADLGIDVHAAHRATDDARVCMEVFLRSLRALNPGGQGSFF